MFIVTLVTQTFYVYTRPTKLSFSGLFSWIDPDGIIAGVKDVFGAVYNFFAVDMYAVFTSDEAQVVAIVLSVIMAILAFISFLWMAYQAMDNPDELRQGHEVRTWRQRQVESRKKVKAITVILTGCLTAFLPVTRTALSLVKCNPVMKGTLPKGDDFLECEKGGIRWEQRRCHS